MMVVVLRPEPGAGATARLARTMGLEPVVAPLFRVRPLDWTVPGADGFDAVMLTSANGARHAGAGLHALLHHPCYAVGEATGEAAAEAGFGRVRAGPSDGAALVRMMAEEGVRAAIHLCGRDRIALDAEGVSILPLPVYASEPGDSLPADAQAALREGAVALLHSPRAGARFAALVDGAGIARGDVKAAAISEAAAAAAGGGWRLIEAAGRPRDDALLELAAKLCKDARLAGTEDGR